MITATQLVTDRLLLRPWEPRDRAAFAAINSDPAVMRYFVKPMTEEESAQAMDRYNLQLDRDGFTMWAAEELSTQTLAGVIGAQTMRFIVPNLSPPAVEIGWRLGTHAQARGLATEGARAVLDHLRATTNLHEIVAITTPDNEPSQHVMRKLGMHPRPELSFDHPLVPADSPRRRHVLYSLPLHRATGSHLQAHQD